MHRHLCFLVFALVPAVALASGVKPVRGIDVIVEKRPPGGTVKRATTDAEGSVVFSDLEPGHYVITIDPCADHTNAAEGRPIDPLVNALAQNPDAKSLVVQMSGTTCPQSSDLPLRTTRASDGTRNAIGTVPLIRAPGGLAIDADVGAAQGIRIKIWTDANQDGTIE